MKILENYSLKKLNTFEIEASARFYVEISSTAQAVEALTWAKEKDLPIFILGGGSNILISDTGVNGLVIHNKIRKFEIRNSPASTRRQGEAGKFEIGAGENWDEVVKRAVEENFAGIECLSGIPGSAGGAVVQNIGAYGQTLKDVVEEVVAVEAATGQQKIFSKNDCGFEYRNSLFKSQPERYMVISFKLKLTLNGKPTLTYADIANYFSKDQTPSLPEVRKAVIETRAKKAHLIMRGYKSYKSAGSYFKNPVVSVGTFEKIRDQVGAGCVNWFWPDKSAVKVAAACLIQQSGFPKGYTEGSVGISPDHPLVIINLNQASASQIRAFAEEIKMSVFDKFGVNLEEEVQFVGNFD